MEYIITENQYEKLIQASLKRHSKDPERNIKEGSFNYDGSIIKYSIMNKNNESIYANYKYKNKTIRAYIMSDENFIQLSKDDQEKAVEYKIKRQIDQKLKQS